MTALDTIESEIRKHPKIKYVRNDDSIVIVPANESGFEIVFHGEETEYTVHYKGWHEHFSNLGEAIECIKFGLSNKCRLKEYSRGDRPYKWVVEYFENDQWLDDSETGFPTLYIWKKKNVIVYQNNLI